MVVEVAAQRHHRIQALPDLLAPGRELTHIDQPGGGDAGSSPTISSSTSWIFSASILAIVTSSWTARKRSPGAGGGPSRGVDGSMTRCPSCSARSRESKRQVLAAHRPCGALTGEVGEPEAEGSAATPSVG